MQKRLSIMKNEMTLAIDSGAHTLYEHVMKQRIKKGARKGAINWNFSKSKDFWEYVDLYGEFLQKYTADGTIDLYINVDVIFDPRTTWEVQNYMESNFNLRPMPVVHYGEDFEWIKKYIKKDYDYIGIGGVGQDVSTTEYVNWGDMLFKTISDDKGLPVVKTHGFALTSNYLLRRYPFYSVDSSSWVQYSQFGIILIPGFREGKYTFDKKPEEIIVSTRAKPTTTGKHFEALPKEVKKKVLEYIERVGFKMGKSRIIEVTIDYKKTGTDKFVTAKPKEGKTRLLENRIELGLCNDHEQRDMLNYLYFMFFQESLPSWPWPFKGRKQLIEPKPMQSERFDNLDFTRIIMGGNFDLQVYKHKEERMLKFIMERGFDYNRMVSFFFGTNNLFIGSDKIKNILEVKKEYREAQDG